MMIILIETSLDPSQQSRQRSKPTVSHPNRKTLKGKPVPRAYPRPYVSHSGSACSLEVAPQPQPQRQPATQAKKKRTQMRMMHTMYTIHQRTRGGDERRLQKEVGRVEGLLLQDASSLSRPHVPYVVYVSSLLSSGGRWKMVFDHGLCSGKTCNEFFAGECILLHSSTTFCATLQ